MAIPIHDPDDPRLGAYRDLRGNSQRADPQRFFAESETAVRRLLESRFEVRSVLATPSRAERLADLVADRCPLFVAERALLSQVVGYDLHRGVIAAGVRPALDRLPPLPDGPLRVVVAAGLSDPANVGALVRCCRAFGVDLLVVDPRGADPFTPRAVRASMGNVFALPIALLDAADAVEALRAANATPLASTVGPSAESVTGFEPPLRWALVLGNEGTGLSDSLIAACAHELTIPIAPAADSLNVAAASAVLLHELCRLD